MPLSPLWSTPTRPNGSVPVQTDEVLRNAVERLGAAGIDAPEWDAHQLLAHVVGVPRSALALTRELSDEQFAAYDALVARRVQREPLQYLTGRVGFRYIELDVGPGVFVPRPETEVVAGLAIERAVRTGPEPLIVDLCSGSGALALSIANELPASLVHAVEREADAVRWLQHNADIRQAAGDTPVTVHQDDAQSALPDLDGTVDVVVANPPYVAADELAGVDPEVREHDPHSALVAGHDGLSVIRQIVLTAERLLHPGGWLVIEHADRQGESCPAILTARLGWSDVTDYPDLAGRPRCTTARWTGHP
jgi:release factor glutamine methyltransferase